MQDKFNVLSIWQPFASLLVFGIKTVDTRPNRPPKDYRGPLLIQATSTPRAIYCQWYCNVDPTFRAYVNILYERIHGGRPYEYSGTEENSLLPGSYIMPWKIYREAWVNGAIIGRVELHDAKPAFDFMEAAGGEASVTWQREFALGDLSSDRWAWLCRDPQAIDIPVPVKGAFGIWPLRIKGDAKNPDGFAQVYASNFVDLTFKIPAEPAANG